MKCPGSGTEHGSPSANPRLMVCNDCGAEVPYSTPEEWWKYAIMRPHEAAHSDGTGGAGTMEP